MSGWMEDLEKLNKLRNDNLISEEEYEIEKAALLPSIANSPDSKPTYNLGGLGKAISILAVISSIMGLLSLIAFANRASVINDIKNGTYVSWADIDNADTFVGVSTIFEILIGIPLAIILIIWAWRAAGNLEAWGKSGRWSRGWAIGGWFCPIMFFFVPYQVISDAWKNALNSDSGQQRNNLWLAGFVVWWIGYALNVIGSMIGTDTIDDAIAGDVIYAASGVTTIAAGILIAIAFNQMSKRHT